MICPVCKKDMIVVEYQDIELDCCTACRGVWFDSGELELMLKLNQSEEIGEFVRKMNTSPDASTSEKDRKCPICDKKMKKKDIGENPKIVVDVCANGHGLWFDNGEIVQFADQVTGETDNAAIKYIREFFGKDLKD